MTIAADDFSAFVRATSKTGCSHCESAEFSVLGTGTSKEAAKFVLQPMQVSANFLYYATACPTCGIVDMFLADRVEKWVAKNRKAAK